MDLGGQPMLARVVERARRAETLDEILVATTDLPADDAVAQFCAARGWPVFRGSPTDLLDRYYQAAKSRGAEIVVRVTCDCPLIEPEILDAVVRLREARGADYAANGWSKPSFPRGLSAEAFTFSALERAWKEDENPAWREHATPYLYKHPELFKLADLVDETDRSGMRWTVDTPEDLAFVRRIYEAFGRDDFSWKNVLALLEKHPEWLEINRHVAQKEL